MNRRVKAMVVALMAVAVAVAAGCTKPDEPSNSGHDDNENDTLIDNGNSNVYGFVDLGLPSGTLWATCNVGADVPEDYGDYFAWGEVVAKDSYDWKSYKYGSFLNERYALTKYCTDSFYGLDGFVDSLCVLEPDDDAATINWGADWRTPTIEEWEELARNTTSVWTVLNDVHGWRFTASNGNSLFLPDAGYWWEGEFNHADLGIYWSVTLNTDFPYRAWGFHFNSDSFHLCGSSDRNRGQSVRAVRAAK